MADDKDRLGDKLKDKQRAEEDRFFRERDQAAIERLRRQKAGPEAAAGGTMQCPRDGTKLTEVNQFGVTVEECPTCHGMWLDPGELETIANRERDSWLGRLFFRPKR